MDYLKLKAWTESGQAWPVEGISARIIMTHTQSIINLACIIRKHESSHVVKVLLVVALSSLCPDALPALPAHCWSFTERALIYAAARLLAYCLYVQSRLVMMSLRGTEMNKWESGQKNMESSWTVRKYFFLSKLNSGDFMIWWLRRSVIWLLSLHDSMKCKEEKNGCGLNPSPCAWASTYCFGSCAEC